MKLFTVYARLYWDCLVSALAGIGRNLWTLLLPMGLMVAFVLLAGMVAPLGMGGGIIMGLARSAAMSIWCYFASEIVAHSKVGLEDFKTSIGAYFWSWINLFFVLWIVDLLLATGLGRTNPNLPLAMRLADLMALVVLNAAPEVITQKGSRGGLETIQRSFAFLQESWIEWFLPNALVVVGVLLFIDRVLPTLPAAALLPIAVAAGAFAHVFLVFRGHLFKELDGSTHRQRMYRRRTE